MTDHLISLQCLNRAVRAAEGLEIKSYGCFCPLCSELLPKLGHRETPAPEMSEERVRSIVAEMFGFNEPGRIAVVQVTGAVSRKMIGELVGDAGLSNRYVVVDFSKARSVGGKKVWWG